VAVVVINVATVVDSVLVFLLLLEIKYMILASLIFLSDLSCNTYNGLKCWIFLHFYSTFDSNLFLITVLLFVRETPKFYIITRYSFKTGLIFACFLHLFHDPQTG